MINNTEHFIVTNPKRRIDDTYCNFFFLAMQALSHFQECTVLFKVLKSLVLVKICLDIVHPDMLVPSILLESAVDLYSCFLKLCYINNIAPFI